MRPSPLKQLFKDRRSCFCFIRTQSASGTSLVPITVRPFCWVATHPCHCLPSTTTIGMFVYVVHRHQTKRNTLCSSLVGESAVPGRILPCSPYSWQPRDSNIVPLFHLHFYLIDLSVYWTCVFVTVHGIVSEPEVTSAITSRRCRRRIWALLPLLTINQRRKWNPRPIEASSASTSEKNLFCPQVVLPDMCVVASSCIFYGDTRLYLFYVKSSEN